MNVSTSTPAAITNANSRNERSGTIASSAKLRREREPGRGHGLRGRRHRDRDRLAQA